MWKALLASLLFVPTFAHAAIFDSADILPQNSAAGGVLGEILLSDPTSEGIEFQGRYGLSDAWNVKGILGFGTKAKRFRIGGETVYNVLPDWEGQLGFSLLGSAIFLNRNVGSALQVRAGPMIHKKISTWSDLPATLYLALPFYFEAHSGTYTTGSQLVFGSLFDVNDGGRAYVSTEVGIRLARADSYLLVGLGIRFGNLRFERASRGSSDSNKPSSNRGNSNSDRDFTDADFKKP